MTEDAPKEEHKSHAAQEGKDLDRVTDFHEERELDADRAKQAISDLGSASAKKTQEAAAVERELAKLKLDDTDVEFLANEFEVSKDVADRALRQSGGDRDAAFMALLRA